MFPGLSPWEVSRVLQYPTKLLVQLCQEWGHFL